MTLGIFTPPDESGPIRGCSRLYFTVEFLWIPSAHFVVTLPPVEEAHAFLAEHSEFDHEHWHALIDHGYDLIRTAMPTSPGSWFLWPRGTLITNTYPTTVVWKLTGRYFPLTTTTAYEGRWPD
jgi:hypothetical protein